MNAESSKARVLVVDDHSLFRRGLIALLAGDGRFEVVAEAGDAAEAQRRAAECQPDVILLDQHLPGVLGADAVAGLLEVAPAARVLMLTVSEDEADLARALRQGACGYLLKTTDSDVLIQSLLQVLSGQSAVSPEMTSKLVNAFQSLGRQSSAAVAGAPSTAEPVVPEAQAAPSISPREQEILAHIAKGASNKEIARALGIAETTVKIHVQHILRKLGLSSRVQAAVFASQRGL
ncbi:DNA-binding response regulator [Paucibacter aquatile]|uniref:DNA-binding response regulator n=1 Tax=Kinneretia aquatilis TaxID=2070761 RepID=A0A2N8KVU0_9BURK|nr:response regulator transcription factor [Paucibacter aquatile]PND37579.1 DNA-binding response regulator [Paucibacter aquatile]